MSIFNRPPTRFTLGANTTFTIHNQDCPPPAWTAFFAIATPGQTPVIFTASQSDTSFLFSFVPAGIPVGPNGGTLYFQNGETRVAWKPFPVLVLPDPTQAMTPTPEMTALAFAQGALTSLVSSQNSSVSVNGKTFTLRNLSELQTIIDRLQARVDYQLTQLGLSNRGGGRLITTRMAM